MVIDVQRKFRYQVELTVNSTGTKHTAPVDEFTPPDVRSEPVTKQNQKLGQITLVGPKTYGEATFRLALRIGSDSSSMHSLLNDLEDLQINDTDTCNISLTMLNYSPDSSASVNFKQLYKNCRLTGYKLDAFSSKADDDFVHVEITVIPSLVNKVEVESAPGA